MATGTTIIQDAAELRVKESDRLTAMAQELSKMGAQVSERPDGLEIVGGQKLSGNEVDSYDRSPNRHEPGDRCPGSRWHHGDR
jgi:3-phosphoshikimate 1-carboxyvinyltransferase